MVLVLTCLRTHPNKNSNIFLDSGTEKHEVCNDARTEAHLTVSFVSCHILLFIYIDKTTEYIQFDLFIKKSYKNILGVSDIFKPSSK